MDGFAVVFLERPATSANSEGFRGGTNRRVQYLGFHGCIIAANAEDKMGQSCGSVPVAREHSATRTVYGEQRGLPSLREPFADLGDDVRVRRAYSWHCRRWSRRAGRCEGMGDRILLACDRMAIFPSPTGSAG